MHLDGDLEAAADLWLALGCAYQAADCLADSSDPDIAGAALDTLTKLGARPRARHVTERLRAMGRSVPRGPKATTRRNPEQLTDREVQVAQLLAAGRTDHEIADSLVISRKTASHHVSHVLGKLGARNRSEAAAIAIKLRL
jgi:DNA-binding NarL/FixJ family response regulator